MAAITAAGTSKGPIMDPALCRCCRSIKKCRLLTAEYSWSGQKEVYSDMIMDCFGLLLSHLDGDSKESCICATCVVRLRDACAFRQQALQCEEAFLNSKLQTKEEQDIDNCKKFDIEVKTELLGNESDNLLDNQDDHHNHSDIEPDLETKESLSELKSVKSKPVHRTTARKRQNPMKRELLGKIRKLKVKLDSMLDKPAEKRNKKETQIKIKLKDKFELDHNEMLYSNAVKIVINSYVCPFLNRISNYYCYYCRDQFLNPSELREHTLTHDPKELFESMMPNKKIPKIDITKIDCRLCDEKIDTIELFKRHISNVHNEVIHPVSNEFLKFKLTMENLKCTECDSSFPYFDSLTKHMIEHFGTYICHLCGSCFLESNSLRTHIKTHSKVETNFPCEICGKNLKSKYSRHLHIATVHEKLPTVNCYKCDASFLSYALRNRHLIEVHGDKRTFPCKSCDKVYNRRKTLMEHNRRNHLKVFRHQCDLCEQRFYLPSRLKEHMATHTGERNFRCEYCEKSYPRLQSLQEHIRSHSNERRYKCDLCNSAFTQSGSLKNHMKSHHQGYELDSFT